MNIASPHNTILIIDDDPHITRALVRCLGSQFVVRVAHDVASASLCLRDATSLSAVVSDLMLANEPDGLSIMAAAQQRHPNAKRVLISGSAHDALIDDAIASRLIDAFVPKPCVVAQLLRALGCEVADDS